MFYLQVLDLFAPRCFVNCIMDAAVKPTVSIFFCENVTTR